MRSEWRRSATQGILWYDSRTMPINDLSSHAADQGQERSSGSQLPPLWSLIAARLAADQTVPRGLLLRALSSQVPLVQLVAAARAGAELPALGAAVGLTPEQGALVRDALLQSNRRPRPVRAPVSVDRGLVERLRQRIDEGASIEMIVASHGFTPAQRLHYLIQTGLTAYAGSRRQQARKQVPALVGRGEAVPEAVLCTAIGISPAVLSEILVQLRAGEGLMQVMERNHLPWPDARLIAQAISWKPSWRKREQRVGRLTLAEVLSRAAAKENPVWIAEAAGVRAQWIRHVLKREGCPVAPTTARHLSRRPAPTEPPAGLDPSRHSRPALPRDAMRADGPPGAADERPAH
jgi:hypothetical protein